MDHKLNRAIAPALASERAVVVRDDLITAARANGEHRGVEPPIATLALLASQHGRAALRLECASAARVREGSLGQRRRLARRRLARERAIAVADHLIGLRTDATAVRCAIGARMRQSHDEAARGIVALRSTLQLRRSMDESTSRPQRAAQCVHRSTC